MHGYFGFKDSTDGITEVSITVFSSEISEDSDLATKLTRSMFSVSAKPIENRVSGISKYCFAIPSTFNFPYLL
jgi:hypothetical protein